MDYSIVQTTLEPLSVEALRRAFRVLPDLTDLDASSMARDAYGVLVDGLALEPASRLHEALKHQGIETQVVPSAGLPPLSPPRRLRRLDCGEDALTVYDALGRPERVDWSRVGLVAAGDVCLTTFSRVETERVIYRGGPRGGAYPIVLTDVTHKESASHVPILEVHLETPPRRLHVKADEFQYNYLGAARMHSHVDNYLRVVLDVLRLAPRATLNRGAQSLRADGKTIYQYPSRHAFEEELVWLLWHKCQS